MKYDTAIPVGSGSMGEVFKAWDPTLERHVALKFLRRDDPELARRMLREARAQARIDHPNVCRVYEVGDLEGRPYIAMQLIEGKTLDEVAPSLPLEQKVALLRTVAEAVQAAHRVGLVHRDLKPSNVLVEERENGELVPYVVDFGIARERHLDGPTLTGQVVGTPGYMSPEQARGEVRLLDRRSDVWSLGAVLYELLAGRPPFDGGSSVEVILSVLQDEPTPLRRRERHVPPDLEAIAFKCLEKDPERRYGSAAALARDLGSYLAGEPVEARAVGWSYRLGKAIRRHRVTASVVAAAVAVVLVSGAFGLDAHRDAAEQARLVSGLGHLALDDPEATVERLEAVWRAGLRTPRVSLGLAQAYGALYRQVLRRAAQLPDEEARTAALENARRRFRDPARDHLRRARREVAERAAWVEGMIAVAEEEWAHREPRGDRG